MNAPTRTLLALVLLGGAAAADDGPPAASKPAETGPLLYLGLNRCGAEEWWRVKDGAVVIRVPGGNYLRRPYEGTVATAEPEAVPVASFYVDKCEVTNARFARFLQESKADEDTGFVRKGVPGLESMSLEEIASLGGVTQVPGEDATGARHFVVKEPVWRVTPGLEQFPVTACTGEGALAYAKWAGARLPRADEWMKAAGGAEGRLYPWGDAAPDVARANFGQPAQRGLDPVGSHPLGASPFGCLDMAGNAYDRVMCRVRGREGKPEMLPVMLKGGSWVSSHPLNLRVLDLCMQPMEGADRSVGFRCAMDDPEPDRPARTAEARPVLRLARDFDAAVAEAKSRNVPIFLSLLHDTCGQCDRSIAQCYRDPRFVRYCNENMVVVFGHQPWDAEDRPHPANPDGSCTVHPGITCREHEETYRHGLAVVKRFLTSPGNFVLDPGKTERGAGEKAVLIPERDLPKWGDAVDEYLAAFDRARRAMGSPPPGDAR